MTAKKDAVGCPPWQDKETLARNICASPGTVDNYVAEGILPAPRKFKGKPMWKWSEVDEMLTAGGQSLDAEAERIRNGTRRASETRAGY